MLNIIIKNHLDSNSFILFSILSKTTDKYSTELSSPSIFYPTAFTFSKNSFI
jgi:hypothetical protein